MMAAAQAAAEAALREALAKESEHERHDISQQQFHQQLQQQQQHQQQHQQQQVGGSGIMDVAMNAAIQGMEGLDQSVLEQDEMRLMRALQAAEADGQMNVLQDLLQGNASGVDGGSVQTALLQMLARQEQEQLASLKKKAISSVPEEHYLTVAQNGTILEATKMATGIPADALLMSSAYDNVYDEDLPGFLCVKTKIWDQGVAEVPVYIRRRNVEGEWFWLESKA